MELVASPQVALTRVYSGEKVCVSGLPEWGAFVAARGDPLFQWREAFEEELEGKHLAFLERELDAEGLRNAGESVRDAEVPRLLCMVN